MARVCAAAAACPSAANPYEVDFDLLTQRNRAYMTEEKLVLERHECRVGLNQ
jgi:hypothetical protein